MDTVKHKSTEKEAAEAVREKPQDHVDFEVWAIAVRQQMMETLRKRGSRY